MMIGGINILSQTEMLSFVVPVEEINSNSTTHLQRTFSALSPP